MVETFNNLGYFEYQSTSDVQLWLKLEKERNELSDIKNIYGQNTEFYSHHLNENVFGRLDFELVLYDEIEKFREYDHPEFSYPYQNRKSKLNSFTLENLDFTYDDILMVNDPLNYEYSNQAIKFQGSEVCLESHWFKVITDFVPQITGFIK